MAGDDAARGFDIGERNSCVGLAHCTAFLARHFMKSSAMELAPT
jgi:hypothetical protein